jgi:hypothetical protein
MDLNRILRAWKTDTKLLRGDHYFWIQGGHVQKSLEGLLRAVLHALLSGLSQSGVSENLETIKYVCESRWLSTDKGRAWSCKELKEMLSRLALNSNVKVFLLIDALDECDPQDRQGDLADVILWLSLLPNVKLCVSCRPWAPFTRRFDKATVLHLDQLTYHDMEVYIEKRLLCAEVEADLCSDFRDGALPARDLIYDVASAANGVFLWVELIVNALCSEIRTGCSIDQLRLATSQFPTDLDKYFQKLIFGRIGTTRPNIPKTAAALKLAMVLKSELFNPVDSPRVCGLLLQSIPMSNDYLNFWLLSVGQLEPGFSWADQLNPRYLAFDTEKKLHQTKAFLEEACKDLLVIHKHEQSYNVEFIHRTAFDFLCDNPSSLPIEKHAPHHFSDEGFAMDLLKLRCICRLQEIGMDCMSSRDLLRDVLSFHVETALEIDQQWLLACESTVLETSQTRCNCIGLGHLDAIFLAENCASSGLHRFLLETAQDMPHGAFWQRYGFDYDYLAMALLELEKADTRKVSTIRLLDQALGCGCDPNVSLRSDFRGNTCGQSKRERWLQVQYLYSQQHSRAAIGDGEHQSSGATKDIDCRGNAYIIELLLQHGADPNCTPCTTDHQFERNCSPTALRDILQCIVEAECFFRLQTLLAACSNEDRRYTLRRNRRKRAIRSYIISEQRFVSRVIDRCPQELRQIEREDWANSRWSVWRLQQRRFLQSLVAPYVIKVKCETWKANRMSAGLLIWCLDCESRSHACLECLHPHSLTKDAPCTDISHFRITQPQGHTTITLYFGICLPSYDAEPSWSLEDPDSVSVSTAYQSLEFGPGELDLTSESALSVLKEWYAKNPIEPDSLQGYVFQDIALPEELERRSTYERRGLERESLEWGVCVTRK